MVLIWIGTASLMLQNKGEVSPSCSTKSVTDIADVTSRTSLRYLTYLHLFNGISASRSVSLKCKSTEQLHADSADRA